MQKHNMIFLLQHRCDLYESLGFKYVQCCYHYLTVQWKTLKSNKTVPKDILRDTTDASYFQDVSL
jgi:hypothetical protein